MRSFRRLRHWKQRFEPRAKFVFNKPMLWNGKSVSPGDDLPDELTNDKNKLKRFWEAGVICLAQFEEPDVTTGSTPAPAQSLVSKVSAKKWVVEGIDKSFRTRTDAVAAAQELLDG